MLKPVTVSSAAAIAKWNQSIPKNHRYHGTAVNVRTKVPIRNELVIQLMRSVGIRKSMGGVSQIGGSAHWPAENNVFFCPSMNLATMHTCEFLILNFGCSPAPFFDGLSRIGQLRRGRATHEQAFDVRARFGFGPARRFEEKSHRVRGD